MKDALGLLLRAGADPLLQDHAGNTPVSLARDEEIRALLQRGPRLPPPAAAAPPAARRRLFFFPQPLNPTFTPQPLDIFEP